MYAARGTAGQLARASVGRHGEPLGSAANDLHRPKPAGAEQNRGFDGGPDHGGAAVGVSVTTLEITGLVVPVPEAAAFAAHPHITLLAPFRPRRLLDAKLQHELAALFAPVAPFDFRLVDIHVFPDGHVYLAPEPAEPFRELTNVLAVRYPDTPPYEGLFDDVIPHCTIDTERVPARLPIPAHAREVHLVHSYADEWDVVARFPFAAA